MMTKGFSSTQSQVPSFRCLTWGCQSFRQTVRHGSTRGLCCVGCRGVKDPQARAGMTEQHYVQLYASL